MVECKSNKRYGFSLAEILVSMLILSVIFLATTRITNHKATKEAEQTPHGFYECYKKDGKTYEYRTHSNYSTVENSTEKEEALEVTDGKCNFVPPKNIYFININCYDNTSKKYMSTKEVLFNENVEFSSPIALVDEEDDNYDVFNVKTDDYNDAYNDFKNYLRVSHKDSHIYDLLNSGEDLQQILFIAW